MSEFDDLTLQAWNDTYASIHRHCQDEITQLREALDEIDLRLTVVLSTFPFSLEGITELEAIREVATRHKEKE